MKILLCMEPQYNNLVRDLLGQAGFGDVICSPADSAEEVTAEFIDTKAEALFYDPGMPYDNDCEKVAKAIAEQLADKPIVFCSVSADIWEGFLRKNGIWSSVINPYEHDDDFEAFFTGAIETAKKVASSVEQV